MSGNSLSASSREDKDFGRKSADLTEKDSLQWVVNFEGLNYMVGQLRQFCGLTVETGKDSLG